MSFTKNGDIFIFDDKHRLMCGDSVNENDISILMNGKKANLLFTDPPYGYNYKSNIRDKQDQFNVIMNDNVMLDFLKPSKNYINGFIFIKWFNKKRKYWWRPN